MTEETRDNAPKHKRKRNGKPAKIALCNPYESFKPLLNEAQAQKLIDLMKSLFHREKEKTKLPWRKLMKLPKELRKERIRELNDKNYPSVELQKQRKSIKFGLNSVARALQNCQLSSCLLAGDVEPEILVNHLTTLAVTRGIPLLIVPNLKKITLEIIGFSCIALGVMAKKDDHYLKILDEEIRSFFTGFQLPANYACFLKKKEMHPVVRKKLIVSNEVKQRLKLVNSKVNIVSKKLSDSSEHDFFASSSLNFLPLNTESNISKISNNQPRIDLSSVYLTPNFKRVPWNPDKLKKKKKKK